MKVALAIPKRASITRINLDADGAHRVTHCTMGILLSLSRLNYWLPWGQAHLEVVQGTAEFHHQIADAFFPQTDPVFDA